MSDWPEWKIKAHARAVLSVLAFGMVMGAGLAMGTMVIVAWLTSRD